MVKKYELRIEAEHFTHNDLSNCAFNFEKRVKEQYDTKEMKGVYHNMMAALVFTAFSIEAKVNFVGWSVLKEGWPERASLKEKINLLKRFLEIELCWGERPLQTISRLSALRNTLAHGKPKTVDETKIVTEEPDIWDALKGQWERDVTRDFVGRCREDENLLWDTLLKAAEIEKSKTWTHGADSLKALIEP